MTGKLPAKSPGFPGHVGTLAGTKLHIYKMKVQHKKEINKRQDLFFYVWGILHLGILKREDKLKSL